LIETQINQGRFEEAYAAMQVIVNRIKASTKLAWANERMFMMVYDQVESEPTVSTVYHNPAQQDTLALSDIF
jgi:hypothetical protein